MKPRTTRHVINLSGGIGSWAAGKRVAERYGTANLHVLFADTLIEDADTYRFLIESAANILGHPLSEVSDLCAAALILPPPVEAQKEQRHDALRAIAMQTMARLPGMKWMADGRTIWEVFKDQRFLGNSRVAHCTEKLKRGVLQKWIQGAYDPASTVLYVGIDWTEIHRYDRAPGTNSERDKGGMKQQYAEQGWRYEAPLCEEPYLDKAQLHEWAEREGLRQQRLYKQGAAHANCGGGCVKMGIGGFVRLLQSNPCGFAEWERNEQDVREFLDSDVSILKDRRNKQLKPLTLTQLRKRYEEDSDSIDMLDIGGCGCFVDL